MTPRWTVPVSQEPCGTFAWGGFAVASNLDLPRLHPVAGLADVEVVWRTDEPSGLPEPTVRRRLARLDGSETILAAGGGEDLLRYEVEGVAIYAIRPTEGRVDVFPAARPDPMSVEHYLVNGVLATLAGLRSVVCLHASCVTDGRRAVVFGGPSGAGKSTAAWRRVEDGWRLVADDFTVLRPSERGWLAYPAGRTTRLIGGDGEGAWQNAGKWERYVETATDPVVVDELVLMDAEPGTGAASIVHSVVQLHAGWGWAGPSRRTQIVEGVRALVSEVQVRCSGAWRARR